MGSAVIFNHMLHITREQGFPAELELERHLKEPFTAADFKGKVFTFSKPKARVFQQPPVPVFLVENRGGRWICWGKVRILEQTIRDDTTSGKFEITEIYDPEYLVLFTKHESERSYF